jgi:hypothetical protein
VGEKQNKSFQLCFNGFLKVNFQGSRVTSDGGLILVRELDEHLGLSQLIAQHLTAPRGTNSLMERTAVSPSDSARISPSSGHTSHRMSLPQRSLLHEIVPN